MKADGGVAMLTSLFVGTGGKTIKAPVRFIPKSPQTSGTNTSPPRNTDGKTGKRCSLPEKCAEY